MNTHNIDIKLPPLPEPDGYLTNKIIGRDVEVNGYFGKTMKAYAREAVQMNAVTDRPELVAVALATCDAVDALIEKWYATRGSGCLPKEVVSARGASKLLRAIVQEDNQLTETDRE